MGSHELAGGDNYFGPDGFPITVRHIYGDRTKSHEHDLTEIEHTHDFCELVIVVRGRGEHHLEGTDFPVCAGDVFLLQQQQSHYFHKRVDLELMNIMYKPEEIGIPENSLRKLPGYCAMFLLEPSYRRTHRFASRLHLGRLELATAIRTVETMEHEVKTKAPGYEAALLGLLVDIIVFLSREYISTDSTEAHALLRVGEVIGSLENDFVKDWKLPDLLKIAHMSRSSLMRVFKKATGQSPIEYLLMLRIQKAMELLRKTDWTITKISHEVGFTDSNYFSRLFRKLRNESPTRYRMG